MIRGTTLIALFVTLALACVFGQKGLESKKPQESESVLVDIDPNLDEALDNKDHSHDNDDGSPAEHVRDPFWGWGRRKRRKYYPTRRPYTTRRPYHTHKPYPTHKPYHTHKPYPTHKPYHTHKPYPTHKPACSTSRPAGFQWNNVWQGKMFFECPRGESLTYMKSVFRDCHHDRIWEFRCGYNEASKEYCHWSHNYANDATDGIFFNCPNHGFVSGVESIYINGDRRFKFKCCNDEKFDHADCHQSHHLNKAGQDFEFKVDRYKRFYITGISSCFNNEKRDRVWIIDYCKSVADQGYPQKKDAIEN